MEPTNIRKLLKITGWLWIVSVISVFIAIIIVLRYNIALNPSEIGSEMMATTLSQIAMHSGAHIIELVFDELSDLALILLSPLLYLGLNKYNKALALLGSVSFVVGGTILAAHNMGNFALTWLAKDFVMATGAAAISLQSASAAILLTAKWGVAIGSIFFVSGILFYSLLVKEMSSPLGWFGIVASILAYIAIPLSWASPALEEVSMNLFMPMIIWETAFGIWLIRSKKLDALD